jgi:hypothetical protein
MDKPTNGKDRPDTIPTRRGLALERNCLVVRWQLLLVETYTVQRSLIFKFPISLSAQFLDKLSVMAVGAVGQSAAQRGCRLRDSCPPST